MCYGCKEAKCKPLVVIRFSVKFIEFAPVSFDTRAKPLVTFNISSIYPRKTVLACHGRGFSTILNLHTQGAASFFSVVLCVRGHVVVTYMYRCNHVGKQYERVVCPSDGLSDDDLHHCGNAMKR